MHFTNIVRGIGDIGPDKDKTTYALFVSTVSSKQWSTCPQTVFFAKETRGTARVKFPANKQQSDGCYNKIQQSQSADNG